MNREFVPYEQALELKELGFNYQCFAAQKDNLIDYGSEMYDFIYNADLTDKTDGLVALPLYQQAFRWFREKYGWFGGIRKLSSHGNNSIIGDFYKDDNNSFMMFGDTYEDAELKSLKQLIQLIKNK